MRDEFSSIHPSSLIPHPFRGWVRSTASGTRGHHVPMKLTCLLALCDRPAAGRDLKLSTEKGRSGRRGPSRPAAVEFLAQPLQRFPGVVGEVWVVGVGEAVEVR